MTLSCRAQAFSVDSLLRSSCHRTAPIDSLLTASCHVAAASNVQSSKSTLSPTTSRESSSHQPSTQLCVVQSSSVASSKHQPSTQLCEAQGRCQGSSASISNVDMTRRKATRPATTACTDKPNKNGEELTKSNLLTRAKALSENQESTPDMKDNDSCRGLDFTRLPPTPQIIRTPSTTTRSPSLEDNTRKSDSPTLKTFPRSETSSLLVPSCFSHGDVTFCRHPGIISVVDSRGSGSSVMAKLCHSDLWASFHGLGTEMIITKSGRRMFPALKLRLSGLNPDKFYSVRLEFLQPDTRKYRYIYHSSQWMVSGSGDTLTTPHGHMTTEGPISGDVICSQISSFERIKLTNTEPCKPGQVSLVSMQKFQPQVVVEEVGRPGDGVTSCMERYIILFPQTSFMAVTAYQNHQITTLKIASNPFAKGFRESGKTRIPYDSFISPAPHLLTCKAPLDYLPTMMTSPPWAGYFQNETFNRKRVNDQQSVMDLCSPLKMKKHGVHKSITITEHDNAAISPSQPDQLLLYSTLQKPYILLPRLQENHVGHLPQPLLLPHLQDNHINHPPQHLLDLQHQLAACTSGTKKPTHWLQHSSYNTSLTPVAQQHSSYHSSPLTSLPPHHPSYHSSSLTSLAQHHPSYHPSLLAPLPLRIMYEAHAETARIHSDNLLDQPPPAHIPSQIRRPRSDPDTSELSVSRSPQSGHSPAISSRADDLQSSSGPQDLSLCSVINKETVHNKHSPPLIQTLPPRLCSGTRSRSSDTSTCVPPELAPLRCVTEPAKMATSEQYGCTGCDYPAMWSGYDSTQSATIKSWPYNISQSESVL